MSILGSFFGGSSNENYEAESRTYSYKYDNGEGRVSGHKETDCGDKIHCTNYDQPGKSRGIRESWDMDNNGNISGYHITDQDDNSHWDEEKGEH